MILEPDNGARSNVWDEKTDEILVRTQPCHSWLWVTPLGPSGVCPRLCAGSTLICATDLTGWVTDITSFLILTTASAVASTRLLNATQLLKYVYTSNSPAIFTITDSTHLHWTVYIFVFVCVPVLSDWSIVVQNLPVITKFSNNSKRKKMKMNCASYNRIDCEQSLC